MRSMAIGVIACLVALATTASAAHAAGDGMLAAVSEGKLVTVNADGSGQRTLWAPTSEITGRAWWPDGNKLALIAGGKLVVWDLASGTSKQLPEDGFRHADPTWSSDGSK